MIGLKRLIKPSPIVEQEAPRCPVLFVYLLISKSVGQDIYKKKKFKFKFNEKVPSVNTEVLVHLNQWCM